MNPRKLILPLAAFGLLNIAPVALAKDKPAPPKAEKSGGAKAKEYVDLMNAMFENMSDTADAVTGLSTEDEIAGGIEALETGTKDLREMQKRLKKLGVPSEKVKAEIDTHSELGPKGQEAAKHLQDAMKGIPQDTPEFGTALQAYGTALTELGNDLNALESAASGKPPAATKPAVGTGKTEDYLRVLNDLLEVQNKSGDVLLEVTDEATAKVAARKLKGLTAEAKQIVEEFRGLGAASAEANEALQKNKDLPARTQEVVAHIREGAQQMADVPGAKEIVGPAMEEFANMCKSIGEEAPAGDPGKKPAESTAPAATAADYVEVMTEFFKSVEQGCGILEGVTDEATATKASKDLEKCSQSLAKILERKEALPEPAGEVADSLQKNKTLPVLGKKAKARFVKISGEFENLEIDASDEVKEALEKVAKGWLDQVNSFK